VAVLPLRNLSNDASQEYFSDGMTDELITALAKVRQLRVISRTSVQRYRSTAKDLPEIARELKVDAVVEGSVARSGDRVRITAQLIDARSDTHLWADSYERDVRDVLVLQGEVAARIAAAVGITLSASDQARLRATPVVSPAAHEAYLRGNVYWNRFTCEGFQRALDYYTEAMTLAPGFAEAHAALADTHYTLEDWACSEPDGFAKARAAALRSVALQPELARAHAVLGEIAFAADWDWTNAEARLRRAVDLDPSDADIHATYAIYLMAMNRQAEGLHELTQALALAPVSEGTNVTVIYLFYLAHRFDEAIAQSRRTLELYPLSGAAYYWLGQAYERKGMNDEAAAAFLHPPDASLSPLLEDARQAHRKAGMRGYWRYQLARIAKQGPLQLCLSAPIYARLGERDRALAQLERDFESHCEDLRFLAVDPVFDGVRGDSRFQALLARMRLPTAGGPSGAARVADTGH
jgi:TolB-like protein/Tfp pilus assembly protein PilF